MKRLDPHTTAPESMKHLLDYSMKIQGLALEHSLAELVKIRASQINGCAGCLHMHTQDARAHGESDERLHLVAAWREAPCFSDRERAALAWTEALTRLADTHAPDADYALVQAAFTPKEQVDLTLLIVTINAWNRIAVGFRAGPPIKVKVPHAA